MCVWFNFFLECPVGWIDAKHVNLGCLYFEKNKAMSWTDSRDYCETLDYENSHLVEIYDSTQQRFLKEMLLQFDKSFTWWIGLNDREKEGIWKWTYSGNVSTYFSWGNNEPDGGTGENCISLWYTKDYGWCDCAWWGDMHPICQF